MTKMFSAFRAKKGVLRDIWRVKQNDTGRPVFVGSAADCTNVEAALNEAYAWGWRVGVAAGIEASRKKDAVKIFDSHEVDHGTHVEHVPHVGEPQGYNPVSYDVEQKPTLPTAGISDDGTIILSNAAPIDCTIDAANVEVEADIDEPVPTAIEGFFMYPPKANGDVAWRVLCGHLDKETGYFPAFCIYTSPENQARAEEIARFCLREGESFIAIRKCNAGGENYMEIRKPVFFGDIIGDSKQLRSAHGEPQNDVSNESDFI
jgi:hypothetical protein